MSGTARPAERAARAALVATLLAANLFVFGPFTLYSGNAGEFSVPLDRILRLFAVPLGAAVATIVVLAALVRRGWTLLIGIVFGLGCATWLQQNLLVWDYGLLDGSPVDWDALRSRAWIDGLVWVAVILCAVLLARRRAGLVGTLAVLLLALQASALGIESARRPAVWSAHRGEFEQRESRAETAREIFRFSNQHNVIHIVLDQMQSDVLAEILRSDPERYRSKLRGFTFFADCLGSFPSTWSALLASLSAEAYQNSERRAEYEARILAGPIVGNVFKRNGFEVDVANLRLHYMQGEVSRRLVVDSSYGLGSRESLLAEAAELLDLVAFRSVPHSAKRAIYNDQAWRFRRLVPRAREAPTFQFSGKYLYEDLIAGATVGARPPSYKFFHFVHPHAPPVFDENCDYLGKVGKADRKSMKRQSTCAWGQTMRFLDRLAELGVYDSSTILIQSDHGGWLPVPMSSSRPSAEYDLPPNVGIAMPVLLVKPAQASAAFEVSRAPASLDDVPATLFALENLPPPERGEPVFELSAHQPRTRLFHDHRWTTGYYQKEYIDRIDTFAVRGPVLDRSSWQARSVSFSPQAQLEPGRIEVGAKASWPLLGGGWTRRSRARNGDSYAWALGKRASVFVSLAGGRSARIRARLRQPQSLGGPQIVRIQIDGRPAGEWTLAAGPEWLEREVKTPVDSGAPSVSEVVFLFSRHREPDQKQEPYALQFDWIEVALEG